MDTIFYGYPMSQFATQISDDVSELVTFGSKSTLAFHFHAS